MASLKSIKKRINTVKSSRQITRAMKMVAAAKLRRAQENVMAARPYAEKLGSVLQKLATSGGATGHPLLRRDKVERLLLMVITSDRGLCGGFNSSISKTAESFLRENAGRYSELTLMTIGRKGNDYLKHRGTIRGSYSNVLSELNYQTAALIAREVMDGFLEGDYDEVLMLYNSFRSVMSQDITMVQLLPIAPLQGQEQEFRPEAIYEPGKEDLLSELLPKNIEVQIFHALLESVAAEHGARMTAMDSASKNASEMIDKLTLQYNRARQAAITKELIEIIGGAESVKG